MNAGPNVRVPSLEISVCSRVDRRIDQGLRVAGKDQFLRCAGHFRLYYGDRENRCPSGLPVDRGIG